MKINEINLGKINGIQSLEKLTKQQKTSGFGDMLKDFVSDVNDAQLNADDKTQDFIQGVNDVELHDVMIAAEKAKTSLDLLMQIRNKALDMYKELTRMQ